MFKIPLWIIFLVVLNIAIFVSFINHDSINDIFSFFNAPNKASPNLTSNQSSGAKNQSIQNEGLNQTSNNSFYVSKCISSLKNYVENTTNITNFTTVETKIFNKSSDAINYVKNWLNDFYSLDGVGRDINSSANTVIVSMNNFKTNGTQDFALPMICNGNGDLGNYSSCLLRNIPNIPSLCYNLSVNLSECEIEWSQHNFWEDINYTIFPKPGWLNLSQRFNFTITSSRNRLEYAGMSITYKIGAKEDMLFSKVQKTTKGDKISITTIVNFTNKTGSAIMAIWFKKKCYDVYTFGQ